ncbi:TRAP transporter small permease [Oceaniglobus trochenteri]|uniref:TRAP transporter small permease n=1 Tax=Oceaniglobus trochenteri TaxID=2763260 RepID=UPI001CFFBEC9|nr:TRAP transporter small permease subunit [Oceaniglobus trochenteri]
MDDTAKHRWLKAGRFALDLIEKHLPAALLLGIVTVFLLQIICRYFFRSLAWPEEMVGFFFLWLVCFGVGYAERDERLIRFDMIHERLSVRGKRISDVIGHTILLVALLALVVPSIQYISYMNFRSSFVLPIKMSLVYAPFMVLLAALILRFAARILRDLRELRAGPPYPPRHLPGDHTDNVEMERGL